MPTAASTAITFLDFLFGQDRGYLCIATAHGKKGKSTFKQTFFDWPESFQAVQVFIEENVKTHNIWYCTSLLSEKKRVKANCKRGSLVWADLDYVNPSDLILTPSVCVETSPQRYQSLWRVPPIDPDVAEDYSRRIAYAYGADPSGWDLTQLLRVPGTLNFKYEPPYDIRMFDLTETITPLDLMNAVQEPDESEIHESTDKPESTTNGEIPIGPMPSAEQLAIYNGAAGVVKEHQLELDGSEFMSLFFEEPSESADWSKLLWRLINLGFEQDLNTEEVFLIALEAKCNKYARDNRPISYLWRDVSKASINHKKFAIMVGDEKYVEWRMPILTSLGAEELVALSEDNNTESTGIPDRAEFDESTTKTELPFEEDSFLQDYKKWADLATDAPTEYHEISCFVALSAMVCDRIQLDTSFGRIVPNIWALVLGESTLSRKSTCMNMSMDIINQIDNELIIATEAGSAEGLLTSLSHRPSRTSVFYKDEVAGFFNELNTKSYLSGFAETLTKLYDAPKVPMTRILRKEVITVTEPYFIFFGGGITANVYAQITDEQIQSGFLPRFIVVDAKTDLSKMRPVGPPTPQSTFYKNKVQDFFEELKQVYHQDVEFEVGDQKTKIPRRWTAEMTQEAWDLYNKYQSLLATDAHESPFAPTAIPTFLRMSFSLLKVAILIAVTRHPLSSEGVLTVEEADVRYAAYYIQKWGRHTVELVKNAGKQSSERLLDRIIEFIRKNPGCTKSDVARRFRLYARDLKEVEATLIERGIIEYRSGQMRGSRRYWTIDADLPSPSLPT